MNSDHVALLLILGNLQLGYLHYLRSTTVRLDMLFVALQLHLHEYLQRMLSHNMQIPKWIIEIAHWFLRFWFSLRSSILLLLYPLRIYERIICRKTWLIDCLRIVLMCCIGLNSFEPHYNKEFQLNLYMSKHHSSPNLANIRSFLKKLYIMVHMLHMILQDNI